MTAVFDFSHALSLLKQGKRVAREAWHEWGEMYWVESTPGPQAYLVANGIKGQYPWLANEPDIVAEDWHEVTG